MTYLAPWRRLLNSLGELALLGALGWLVWVRFAQRLCPMTRGWFTPYALLIYGFGASLIAMHPFGTASHLRRGLRGAAGWLWWAASLFGCGAALYLLQMGSQSWYVFLALIPAVGYLAFAVQARSSGEAKLATKAPAPQDTVARAAVPASDVGGQGRPPYQEVNGGTESAATQDDLEAGSDG